MKFLLIISVLFALASCSGEKEYDLAMKQLKEGKINNAQKTFDSVKKGSKYKAHATKKADSISLILLELKKKELQELIQKQEELQRKELVRVGKWNKSLSSNQEFLKDLNRESKRNGSLVKFELDKYLTGVLIIHRTSDMRPRELSDLELKSYLLGAGTNEVEIKNKGFDEVRLYTTSSRNMTDFKSIRL